MPEPTPKDSHRRAEIQRFLRALRDGLADADAGRMPPYDQVVAEMKNYMARRKA